MMVNLSWSTIVLVAVLVCNYNTSVNHMRSMIIASFALMDIFQVYSIIDIILVWRNKQGKVVLRSEAVQGHQGLYLITELTSLPLFYV